MAGCIIRLPSDFEGQNYTMRHHLLSCRRLMVILSQGIDTNVRLSGNSSRVITTNDTRRFVLFTAETSPKVSVTVAM